MSYFICEGKDCGAVENTALGQFWCRHERGLPRLCSQCYTGTWHGEFPKKEFNAVTHAGIRDQILGMEKAS